MVSTVDGSEILHFKLRLVVYPGILQGVSSFIHSRWLGPWDFWSTSRMSETSKIQQKNAGWSHGARFLRLGWTFHLEIFRRNGWHHGFPHKNCWRFPQLTSIYVKFTQFCTTFCLHQFFRTVHGVHNIFHTNSLAKLGNIRSLHQFFSAKNCAVRL